MHAMTNLPNKIFREQPMVKMLLQNLKPERAKGPTCSIKEQKQNWNHRGPNCKQKLNHEKLSKGHQWRQRIRGAGSAHGAS